MAIRHRPDLIVRIELLPYPEADHQFREACRVLGAAFADLILADARNELAERLGVSPESIDHKGHAIDDETRALLNNDVELRRAA